jgi:hypothetical protein
MLQKMGIKPTAMIDVSDGFLFWFYTFANQT